MSGTKNEMVMGEIKEILGELYFKGWIRRIFSVREIKRVFRVSEMRKKVVCEENSE